MIIRDNVYGDIEVPSKFVELINTKEFQRLRRIKQLATAEQVFPGATHSRFSHSVGVFYVMTKIINHFEKILMSIGQDQYVDAKEKDIILAAALLHDIGHGPFSHAFEKASISTKPYSHEEWTAKIITEKDTEINKVLRNWGIDVPERVIEYINCRLKEKNSTEGSAYVMEGTSPDFKFIFTSLVSSQLDADRMDYLLRDSFNCGVNFGKFDLENLIEGMSIGIDGEGKFRVCVKKSYLANVEEYFFARYQMYRNIYLHPYKVLSETLLEKILNKACDYYLNGKLGADDIPNLILGIFEHADISLQDYLQLDDTVVMGAIHAWSHLESEDVSDLKRLCECFLYRSGYKQILLTDVNAFLEDLSEQLKKENIQNWEWKKELIFIKCVNNARMYDRTGQKPVYILTHEGKVKKLDEMSGLLGEERTEQTIYYNQEFCTNYLDDPEKVKKLLEDYDVRRAIEIEKKYLLREDIYQKVIDVLRKRNYEVNENQAKEQTDHYYDTNDRLFYQNNYTLRFRQKGKKYWITFKSPSDSVSNGEGGQLERNEIEREVSSLNLNEQEDVVNTYFGEFMKEKGVELADLSPHIDIVNNRRKITATKKFNNEYIKEEKYEIVFDNVEYVNKKNGNNHQEQQMEIELKSRAETRINMKSLTDALEREIGGMASISDSKYHRAVDFTNFLQK